MENNKTVILVILVAALVVATAVNVMSQSAGQGFLQVILIIVAGATGWYAGSGRTVPETGEQSITDELTGLHAYNYFIDRLNEEKKRADRFGSRVSMVLIEIDDFKAVSDEHGHARGKDLVKEIGEIVKIQVR